MWYVEEIISCLVWYGMFVYVRGRRRGFEGIRVFTGNNKC